jgi:hypothetical protein
MLLLAAMAMQTAGDLPSATLHGQSLVLRAGAKVVLKATVKGPAGKDLSESCSMEVEEQPAEPLFLGYPHGPKTAEFVPAGRT